MASHPETPVRPGEPLKQVRRQEGLPTHDDPHSAEEEKPYRAEKPGGAEEGQPDINRVNNAVHDGTPQRRPDNADTRKLTPPGS